VLYGKHGNTAIAALHEKDEKVNEERSWAHKKPQRNKRNSEAMRGLGGRQNGAMAWDSIAPFF
jgi:hypothetical protein